MRKLPLKQYSKSFSTRTRNLLTGCLDDKILFYHIPKCGGTSIRESLQSCYLTWNPKNKNSSFLLDAGTSFDTAQSIAQKDLSTDTVEDYPILKLREDLLLYHMHHDRVNFISGHFAFSDIAYQKFSDKYTLITILRDPVERWISSYLFNNFKKGKHRKMSMDIEDYIQSDFSKSQGYEYVKFLGGISQDADYSSVPSIERAKENLTKIDLIGFLEHMDVFVNSFEKRFGRHLNIEKLNKSPTKSDLRDSIITESLKERVREVCQPDIEIYQYATETFLNKS